MPAAPPGGFAGRPDVRTGRARSMDSAASPSCRRAVEPTQALRGPAGRAHVLPAIRSATPDGHGRAFATTPVMPFKKILCAIDFSECSYAAMGTSAQLAAESGAALTLVHVWQPPIRTRNSAALLADDLHAEFVAECEKALEKAKAQVMAQGAPRVETKLLAGVAWDCLVKEAASDPTYDLIVVGTHGRSGIDHVLVGSVAEKVVRHASCPVLVARRRFETTRPR
jgi:nucleotide-binding universal stress UspA family protein